MDHGQYVYFLNGYGIFLSLIFVLFKPKFRRSAVNQFQTEVTEQTTVDKGLDV
jgi:hypothetical protein